MAHFWGITVLVAHVRKHPTYFTQHRFLASWGFVHQVKMLGYGLKHTSSPRESYILAQGSFALFLVHNSCITVYKILGLHPRICLALSIISVQTITQEKLCSHYFKTVTCILIWFLTPIFQGGSKIIKLHLGFQFFFSRFSLNQPANVIRHMSKLGNMMSSPCIFPLLHVPPMYHKSCWPIFLCLLSETDDRWCYSI